MRKKVFSKVAYKRQAGASMPEFALAFPIILLTIVFLIDTGILLFKYSLLTDATAALTRASTTSIGQNQAVAARPCDTQDDIARQSLSNLRAANSQLYTNMTFTILFDAITTYEPYQLVTIEGTFPLTCLLCKFYPSTINLRSKSVLAIERQWACTSPSGSPTAL